MIQVEILGFVAMERDGVWYTHKIRPVVKKNAYGRETWIGGFGDYNQIEVQVTGFIGDWKDSLHKWNGKEWVKV